MRSIWGTSKANKAKEKQQGREDLGNNHGKQDQHARRVGYEKEES